MIKTLDREVASFNPHHTLIKPARASIQEQISLPHLFKPYPYQEQDLFRPLFPHHYPDLKLLGVKPKKRICLVWHRRAGKDLSSINALTIGAYERPGNYLYLLPEQTQAKKVIWRGIDADGVRFIDRIPDALVKKRYESEMLIELINNSTIQFGGSDRYDSWMGTNPMGIILSEYSLQDPMAWNYLRPILLQNDGWAAFIYTFRGKNHGYDLYQMAKNRSETWHASLKTIDDTRKWDGTTPIVTREQYEQEILDGMLEMFARQEFYCDPEAALVGSYYGQEMSELEANKRIGHFPHDPAKQVYTFWDLGADANVVIYAQADEANNPIIIDYFEEKDTRFSDVVRDVQSKPYTYAAHFGPHDTKNRNYELETRINTARDLGLDIVDTDRHSRNDGIEAVRLLLPRMSFHEVACQRLIDALKSYHRLYDTVNKTFKEIPVHDWSSHGSDATRIMAMNWQPHLIDQSWKTKELDVPTDFI